MSTPEHSDAADWRAFNVWVPAINRIQRGELTPDEDRRLENALAAADEHARWKEETAAWGPDEWDDWDAEREELERMAS